MTDLPEASTLFKILLAIVVALGIWWHGSWHGRKYPSKHARVEAGIKQIVDQIEVAGGDKKAALEREVAKIHEAADRKVDAIRAEFVKRFGD